MLEPFTCPVNSPLRPASLKLRRSPRSLTSSRGSSSPSSTTLPDTLRLRQQMTRVSGSVVLDGEEVPLEDVKLRGDRLSFKLAGRKGEFTGQVKGSSIEGTLDAGGTKTPWSAALSG